jgi:hypothetical protein
VDGEYEEISGEEDEEMGDPDNDTVEDIIGHCDVDNSDANDTSAEDSDADSNRYGPTPGRKKLLASLVRSRVCYLDCTALADNL